MATSESGFIKFNDTSEYEAMEVLGVEGVYTPHHVERESLPEGYFVYSLTEGKADLFDKISSKSFPEKSAGTFVSKEQLDFGPNDSKALSVKDWRFTGGRFDFEEFFGCKLSIDCQISNAEAKRVAQMGEGKEGPAHRAPSPRKHEPLEI